MENILHQTFTIKEIMASPIFWACLSILSYVVSGTLYRNFLVRQKIRYNKNMSVVGLTPNDIQGIKLMRLTYPFSAMLSGVIAILGMLMNITSTDKAINRVAEKEARKLRS